MWLLSKLILTLAGVAVVFCNLKEIRKYKHLGCYKDGGKWGSRAISMLDDDRKSIESCYNKAKAKGFCVFGVQSGKEVNHRAVGQCTSSSTAQDTYTDKGSSTGCAKKGVLLEGTGGHWLNDVYKIAGCQVHRMPSYNCWSDCGKKGGPCSQNKGCGPTGMCCKIGYGKDPEACRNDVVIPSTCTKKHCCAYPAKYSFDDATESVESVVEIAAHHAVINVEELDGNAVELEWQLTATGHVDIQEFFCQKTTVGVEEQTIAQATSQLDDFDVVEGVEGLMITVLPGESDSTLHMTYGIIIGVPKPSDTGIYKCTVNYLIDGDMMSLDFAETKLTVSAKESIIEEDEVTIACTTTEDGGCVEWKGDNGKRITSWRGMTKADCEENCRENDDCVDYNYQAKGGKICRLFKGGCTIQQSYPVRQFYRCTKTRTAAAATYERQDNVFCAPSNKFETGSPKTLSEAVNLCKQIDGCEAIQKIVDKRKEPERITFQYCSVGFKRKTTPLVKATIATYHVYKVPANQ